MGASARAALVIAALCGAVTAVTSAEPGSTAPRIVDEVQRDVYVVPFSHLDLYWAGTREECLSRGNRIITKAVQFARR